MGHRALLDAVKKKLPKRGLVPEDERCQHKRSGQQLFGHMTAGGNGEQDLALGFRNSYDKRPLLGAAAGAL